MTFSFIIPFKTPGAYLAECLQHIEAQTNKDFEVILLPDNDDELKESQHVVIPTGAVKPSRKRNIGLKTAKGEIIVFIDDDAYPKDSDYLDKIASIFEREEVGAVGGPQLTPPDDNWIQHTSGEVLSSMGAGQFSLRYKVGRKEVYVQEIPSCNLAVRKALIDKIGGFDESLLTGEDAKLCFSINDAGSKVLYAPSVQVNHHRRATLKRHMRQMYIYGRDKAQMLRETRPNTLFFSAYVIPLLFVTFLLYGGVAAFVFPKYAEFYWGVLILYSAFIFIAATSRRVVNFPAIMVGLFLTHISYGLGYGVGMLTLKSSSSDIAPQETSR